RKQSGICYLLYGCASYRSCGVNPVVVLVDTQRSGIYRIQNGARKKSMNKRVLILCTGNSARSQMAEGLLRYDGKGAFEVFSAGVEPSFVRPEAIVAMQEIGMDISGHRSK